jgi:hypothetical protein
MRSAGPRPLLPMERLDMIARGKGSFVKVLEAGLGHAFNFRFRAAAPPFPTLLGDHIRIHLSPDLAAPDPPLFRRMEPNGDGRADICDAVFLLADYLFGGEGTLPCPDAADANDDGAIDLTDAIFVLSYLFLERSVAFRGAFPFECCGLDPTPDALNRFAANNTDPAPDPDRRDPSLGHCAYPAQACR